MFLTRDSDDCRGCSLSFKDIRTPDFADTLVLPKGEKSGGSLEISTTGLPFGKKQTLWKITIDEVGDSFAPRVIARIIPGIQTEIVYTLLGYTNLGSYQFPSTITWVSTVYPPTFPVTLVATGMTTVISVDVPDRLEDSTFELDDRQAIVVWDHSQHKFIKTAPQLVPAIRNRNAVRIVLLTMLSLTTLVVTVATAKRFASRRS
jgi:hypothetical protein